MLYPLLLVCGTVLLFLYIWEKIKAYSVKAVLLKSVVSMLFIMVGVYGTWLSASKGNAVLLCPFVVLGLVCGLLGDIWLDLKYVFPEKDEPFTYAGFCVFGVGHILYIIGMLMTYYPSGKPMTVFVPILLALVLSIGNAVLEKPMKLSYGKFKSVVIAYGVILFAMVLISGSFALYYGWEKTSLNLIFVGGVFFAISDLILSGTYFGTGKERPIDLALNYITYYGGQFLIASALVFIG